MIQKTRWHTDHYVYVIEVGTGLRLSVWSSSLKLPVVDRYLLTFLRNMLLPFSGNEDADRGTGGMFLRNNIL
jgi:hypothetical protein